MASPEEYAIVGQALIVLRKSLDDIGQSFDRRARTELVEGMRTPYAWISCLAYAATTILNDQIDNFTKGGEDATIR
jgi:hypothetical protein